MFLSTVLVISRVRSQAIKNAPDIPRQWWRVQSIDTVKYSRDLARAKMTDEKFDVTIDNQVRLIAETGATHVAIGTPYDIEFDPFMKKWVSAARKHGLLIWFRGNLSGWEEWFEYPKITKEEHLAGIEDFITRNHDLFVSGDIFTSCTECENGALGDPRFAQNLEEYRTFLINEYSVMRELFRNNGKNVTSNYFAMNGDVAKLVMDKETTRSLGGVITIDHYTKSPQELSHYIKEIVETSGGKVVIGEFGVPIPDIHGSMDEAQKEHWLMQTLSLLAQNPNIIGINYWVSHGGSTHLWNDLNEPETTVTVLAKFYTPKAVEISLKDVIGNPIRTAKTELNGTIIQAGPAGQMTLYSVPNAPEIKLTAPNFQDKYVTLASLKDRNTVIMDKKSESLLFKLLKRLKTL